LIHRWKERLGIASDVKKHLQQEQPTSWEHLLSRWPFLDQPLPEHDLQMHLKAVALAPMHHAARSVSVAWKQSHHTFKRAAVAQSEHSSEACSHALIRIEMLLGTIYRSTLTRALWLQVLNPHNVAGIFKWREALRVMQQPEAERVVSSATRAILIESWRARQTPGLAPPEYVTLLQTQSIVKTLSSTFLFYCTKMENVPIRLPFTHEFCISEGTVTVLPWALHVLGQGQS
jgi:hypothetical protein